MLWADATGQIHNCTVYNIPRAKAPLTGLYSVGRIFTKQTNGTILDSSRFKNKKQYSPPLPYLQSSEKIKARQGYSIGDIIIYCFAGNGGGKGKDSREARTSSSLL